MAHLNSVAPDSAVTITDLFCGCGGSSSGAAAAGAEVYLAMNHWKLAVDSHNENHPDTNHECANISETDARRYRRTIGLIGSPECFPAGTLILTSNGLKPIEQVGLNELVLTHRGRWRAVVRTQSKMANTIIVSGHGNTHGIETTNEHPFYVRRQERRWNNDIRRYYQAHLTPDWIQAAYLTKYKYRWATPCKFPELTEEESYWRLFPSAFDTKDSGFYWLLGRWLGDGSLTFGKNNEVTISCANDEVDEILPYLKRTHADWRLHQKRTATNFCIWDKELHDWLHQQCNHGAGEKQLPVWIYGLSYESRKAVLDGYVSADGHIGKRTTQIDSISHKLALGIRLLAESLGYRAGFYLYDQHCTTIEGRDLNVQPIYKVAWENNASQREAFETDGISWGLIRDIKPGRTNVQVYNLEVEEDHSYVAEGIVVHNCTKHSNAGGLKRKNAAQGDLFQGKAIDPSVIRSRATMWDIVRFTEVHRYEFVIVENVVEVMTTWDSWKPWLYAMHNLGYKSKLVFLNAQFAHGFHHGHFIESFAPQSRDRIYVVFWKKGNKAPKLDIRPQAPCPACCKNVGALQTWKKQKYGKYGIKNGQYVYKCPECYTVVTPYYYAALNCLDFSQEMIRIRDRAAHGMKPLADNTLARIQYGLNKGRLAPVLLDQRNQFSRQVGTRVRDASTEVTNAQSTGFSTYLASAFTFDMSHSASGHGAYIRDPFQSMGTQTTQASSALVSSGAVEVFLQANRDQSPMRDVSTGEVHTQTTALQEYVIGAPGFISQQYGNTKDSDSVLDALPTSTATNKSALILPPAAILTARGDCDLGELTKSMPTQVAAGIQNWVVSQQPFITPYHGGSHQAASVLNPTFTVPTGDSLALIKGQPIDVQDCYFRMLQPHETLQAQGFHKGYVVLGNKDQQQKQIGNANPPPTMELLTRLCMDSLS